jgi:hypothetical protein
MLVKVGLSVLFALLGCARAGAKERASTIPRRSISEELSEGDRRSCSQKIAVKRRPDLSFPIATPFLHACCARIQTFGCHGVRAAV